jgi:acyl-lipid omega-6 desaturase (Delta-12 desaturase)
MANELGPGPSEVRGQIAEERRVKALLPGWATFLIAELAWLAILVAIVFVPWWAKILLGIANGIAIGICFINGHDACHGILLPKRWMNRLTGRLCMLPALHPYTSWVHNHNGLHHGFTNLKEKDPGFPPLDPAEYRSLSMLGRLHYRCCRTWWGLGLLYVTEMWWKWEVMPTKERAPRNPRGFRFDRLLVLAFIIAWIGGLIGAAFLFDENPIVLVATGFVLPQLAWNWLIGFIILQQHTHPKVAWYSELDFPAPSYYQMQIEATPHLIFPAPFRFLMRNVMEHTAHHADPAVPLYQLAEAQSELERTYRRDIVRVMWSPMMFLRTLRVCRLYDYAGHRWVDYDGTPLSDRLWELPALAAAGEPAIAVSKAI